MIRVGLLLLASPILIGCATSGPKFTPATPPRPGKALVYVYRKNSMAGCVLNHNVYVNNSFLTFLRNGRYASCEVPSGTTVFYVAPRYEKLRIETEPGRTYYVNLYIAAFQSSIENAARMKLVDESTGAREICSLASAQGDSPNTSLALHAALFGQGSNASLTAGVPTPGMPAAVMPSVPTLQPHFIGATGGISNIQAGLLNGMGHR